MFLKICMVGIILSLLMLRILALLGIIMCISDITDLKFENKEPKEIQDEIKERKAQIKSYSKGWFTK